METEEKEEITKESTQELEKVVEGATEKEVSIPSEEKAFQKNLLASLNMVWEEITQSDFLTVIVILCFIVLVLIGVKEWKLFQKKRKK